MNLKDNMVKGKTPAEFIPDSGRIQTETRSEFQGESGVGGLVGDKTLTGLAQQFEVHPNQITDGKQQLCGRAAEVFGKKSNPPVDVKAMHAKIGQFDADALH